MRCNERGVKREDAPDHDTVHINLVRAGTDKNSTTLTVPGRRYFLAADVSGEDSVEHHTMKNIVPYIELWYR